MHIFFSAWLHTDRDETGPRDRERPRDRAGASLAQLAGGAVPTIAGAIEMRCVQREFTRYACDMRRLMRRIMVEQEQDTLRHDGIRLSRRIRKLAPNSSSKVTVSASTLDQAAPIAPIVGSIR